MLRRFLCVGSVQEHVPRPLGKMFNAITGFLYR